ncbi:Lar family restriction alleviation protein [Burkholderia seminalis]|uniref:Lar family restriction alleviation protein n=1 Tax=Burkholderia seminalis TaxID=488731 RepID=UPI001F437D6C|nr:Lar family restriction alleviation protein [Burkholderia seminalis]
MKTTDKSRADTPKHLLPCAFCGCTKCPVRQGNGIGDYWLECTDCGASTRLREDGAGCEKDWNRRPVEQHEAAPAEDHECVYENGDGVCRECAALAKAAQPEPPVADERAAQMAHDLRCAGVAGTKAGDLLHNAAAMLEALAARASSPNAAGAEGIRAWETDDGRVISDEQKQQALRDGGASASSVRPYAHALGRIAPAQAAESVARVEKTSVGPKLFVNDVLVYWWLGCMHDEAVKEIARKINAAPPHPAPASAPVGLTDNSYRELLATLIDIYDDQRNNAPESRCYVESAWSEVLGEARAMLAPLPDPAQVVAESPDRIKNALPPEGA